MHLHSISTQSICTRRVKDSQQIEIHQSIRALTFRHPVPNLQELPHVHMLQEAMRLSETTMSGLHVK